VQHTHNLNTENILRRKSGFKREKCERISVFTSEKTLKRKENVSAAYFCYFCTEQY